MKTATVAPSQKPPAGYTVFNWDNASKETKREIKNDIEVSKMIDKYNFMRN